MTIDTPIPGPVRDLVGYNGNPRRSPGRAMRASRSRGGELRGGFRLAIGDGDPRTERGYHEAPYYPWPAGERDLASESMYEYGSRAGSGGSWTSSTNWR